jgi:hypothetical protein
MTGFATFAYSKKYFVSQEIEFISESEIDPEFGESYKAPQDLIRLLADNVGIGTTNITTARQELDVYGTAIVSGRVGIATTQPREELDVIGTVIVSEVLAGNHKSNRKIASWCSIFNIHSYSLVLLE